MTNIRDVLAANLREFRRTQGISQAKLAEKAGLSAQYIAMIELSRKYPSPEVLERIAAALSIEAYDLFTAPASSKDALERLHQDIRSDIKQLIGESLEKIRAAQCLSR